MLRDNFKNRKKPPSASEGGSSSTRRPPTSGQPKTGGPAASQSRFSRFEQSEAGRSAVSDAAAAPADSQATLSAKTNAFADELKRRWQSCFNKSRTRSSMAVGTGGGIQGPFTAGETINGIYNIQAPLSKGGMGIVYRAQHLMRDMPVVVKVMLHDRSVDDPAFIKFVQECKIATTIEHPNVVTVYDWGILADTLCPYMVMEFLPGQSLRDLLTTLRKLPVYEAASLLAQTCIGLAQVHAEDVIHRDLKPENLMVTWHDDGTPDGRTLVKIVDFGIAQLQEGVDFTDGGRIMGTLSYMSPEQIEIKGVDARSDIYSMGVVFYELITGRVPFKGNTIWQTMSMHVNDIHEPASNLVSCRNPELVDALILKCLSKQREHRYQSALELADALLEVAAAEQQ